MNEKVTEYTVDEIRYLMQNMSKMYDVARIVDPIECRILSIGDDGTVSMENKCYGIWKADHKCVNCSSANACRTGCHQEKAERFEDDLYQIQSNPVRLILPDGGNYDAVIELVSIKKDEPETGEINDRASENIDHNAAQYKAIHDELTSILNTGSFYELSRNMINEKSDKSWVMITSCIMNFQMLNTFFGVQKGNEVLIETSQRLKKIADDAEGLCGRIGNDQFALLMPRDRYDEGTLLNVEHELSEHFNSGMYMFVIHFGVYTVQNPSLPIAIMCGRANSALHTIRDNVKKFVAYFDEDMLKKMLFEQEVIVGFSKALKEGQFRMYLQPLVDQNGKAMGAEALIRWVRPNGDMVMPGKFIEILERADLIHELDMYIWECAVKQLDQWKGTSKEDLTISINMSAKDFFNIDVYDVLTKLIDKYQVSTDNLRLEITETALLDDPKSSDEIVRKLRERGFIVELDDFGKGYSSLSMLKNIHADILKIDMSLVREIEVAKRSKTIVRSIVNMAQALDMDIIVEGVETENQLNILSEMGCSNFQGFYFSKPIPTTDFESIYDQYGYFGGSSALSPARG
ncbi:MAG: GGDEF domain-containing phosphodiesterase [Lachnospiraceae bacterium]|nr:GGDEF domain-containing phosphodiesterase [Lachnospiraceae bacterium]